MLGVAVLGTFATGAVWGGESNVRGGTCRGREAGLHLRTPRGSPEEPCKGGAGSEDEPETGQELRGVPRAA